MENNAPKHSFTLCLLGPEKSGKSAIVERFLNGIFSSKYVPTVSFLISQLRKIDTKLKILKIGMAIHKKVSKMRDSNVEIEVNIWYAIIANNSFVIQFLIFIYRDWGGKSPTKFEAMRSEFYNKFDAFMVVFDASKPLAQALDDSKYWKTEIDKFNNR